MDPSTRFLRTPDGVHIAYSTLGEGPPLVFVRGFLSNIERSWSKPAYREYWTALASRFTVVAYDMRGNGLSDREPAGIDMEAALCDLRSVLDELNLHRATLLGQCFGGPIAMAFAASHPERVDRLILDGTYARGADLSPADQREKLLGMMRDLPAAANMTLDYLTNPDPEPTQTLREYYRHQRRAPDYASPRMTALLYEFGFDVDVTDMLVRVEAPTLVLHRRGNLAVRFDLGRELAARIRGAQFVPLAGTAANPWEGDILPSLTAISEFLGVDLEMPERTRQSIGARTILFTDLVASTAITTRMGDRMGQDVVRRHNDIVRRALTEHAGEEVKHTGDGIMASFASASLAAECAVRIQQQVALQNRDGDEQVGVRIGLNAGEPIADEDDLFGAAVQLARRVCDAASPHEVLATNVVRELCLGKGLTFEARGEHTLKGFDEPVALYAVPWVSPGR
jgi:class 3 adenylate cyclase/alpha-beta hydrolase superfamily lysophospholipase